MALGQQPVVAGVLHQASAGLDEALLHTGERPSGAPTGPRCRTWRSRAVTGQVLEALARLESLSPGSQQAFEALLAVTGEHEGLRGRTIRMALMANLAFS